MDRKLALFAIGLVFGGGIGFVIAAGNGITLDGHDHSDPLAHGASHGHGAHLASQTGLDEAGYAPGGICTSENPNGGETVHAHAHDRPLILPRGADAPTLDIALHADTVGGWNLELITEHFRFSADRAGLSHRPGEGHAHLYVNGEKIARLYGNWYHLAALPDGPVEIEVTLNANDHRPLSVGTELVSAKLHHQKNGGVPTQ